MSGVVRLIATAIIWGAVVLILTLGNVDGSNFINLAILLGVAGWATSEVWESRDRSVKSETPSHANVPPEKSKRSDSRLIDSLSEEDLAAIEAVLAARHDQLDEDEQIELNRLLADQEHSRR